MTLASILPFDVASLAVAAPGLPNGVDAWTRASLQRVFKALRGSVIAIVAVEVYDQVQWGFEPAPESWDCPRMLGDWLSLSRDDHEPRRSSGLMSLRVKTFSM